LVKICMRRQFHRAFAGLRAAPGGGGGGGAPPMIITPPPLLIITGPAAPGVPGTLKLMLAPMLSVCARDSASPVT
jgi:hypothetical protein